MELDQKLRYAMFALTAVSFVLAGVGVHHALHIRGLEIGGGAD
jgi:hypothetical protein